MSAYCRPSYGILLILDQVSVILNRARDKRVFVGVDVNAGTPLWGEEVADERGMEVEGFVLHHDMMVLNKPGEMTTFEGYVGGGRNVDVTMVTKDVGKWCWSWRVIDRAWSDHREIEAVCVDKGVKMSGGNKMVEGKWNWRRADWAEMAVVVGRELEVVSWDEIGVDEMAGKLQEIMMRACDRCVEMTRGTERQVRWRCSELEMRTEVRRKRKNWIRYKGDAERQMLSEFGKM